MNNQIFMGFDFGLKQIGIAIGQTVTQTASPLTVVPADKGIPDWAALNAVVAEWNPEAFVVGLPLNMDGSMSDMAHKATEFAKRLEAHYLKKTHVIDERLSTQQANSWFLEHKGRHPTKTDLDTIAAVIILESFLADF